MLKIDSINNSYMDSSASQVVLLLGGLYKQIEKNILKLA